MKLQDLDPVTLGKIIKQHLDFIPLLQQVLPSVTSTTTSGDQYCFIGAPERKRAGGKKIQPNRSSEDLCPLPKASLIYPQFTQLLVLGFP